MFIRLLFAAVGIAVLVTAVVVGRPGKTDPAEASELRERALAHEQLIADCMRDHGFDYVAVVPADVLMEEARAEADAAGGDVEAALDALTLPPDPNDEIVAGLSAHEARAYEQAYWGDGHDVGCYHATFEKAWGIDILAWEEELAAGLFDVEAEIAADPGIIAAKERLLACLEDSGFAFDSFEMFQRFRYDESRRAVEEITGEPARSGGGVDGDHPVWQEHEERMEAFEAAKAPCEDDYRATVQPIENRYLQGLHDSLDR